MSTTPPTSSPAASAREPMAHHPRKQGAGWPRAGGIGAYGRRQQLFILPLCCWLLSTCLCSPAAFMNPIVRGRSPSSALASSSPYAHAASIPGHSCTTTSNPSCLWGVMGQRSSQSRRHQERRLGRVGRSGLLLAMASARSSSDGSTSSSSSSGTESGGAMPAATPTAPPPHSQEGGGGDGGGKREIEPYGRRARFELHRTWQSVTSVDVVEDGQIVGTRGGLPCRTSLRWLDKPKNVLLLMKRGSVDILKRGAELVTFLQAKEGVRVLVERQVKQDLHTTFGLEVAELYGPRNKSHHEVDAVITLGGDGLLMHANWLFQRTAPIILPVNLGSLGFLLPFEYDDIYGSVERMLTQDVQLTLRMRLSCRIIRNGTVVMNLAVMNDVVVERGSSPYLASLDCFCNGQYITTVQADGIIIATPTGSTAYSMSAGGSMVHPGIQALLMTPICPHSLSFRPLLFPDTSVLSLRMPSDARTYAWISFDGRFRHRLMVGDILEVSKSEFPLPTVTHQNVTGDWFASLSKAFNFNQRTRQKPLNLSQPAPEGCEDPIEPLWSAAKPRPEVEPEDQSSSTPPQG